MKVLLIPDKFKGSLDAASVAAAMEEGIKMHFPEAGCLTFAASDGGDGFLDAVAAVRALQSIEVEVEGPLGRPVQARYLWDPETREAFVEMALASGLVLLEYSRRDPLKTHTRGTGQLMLAAMERGAKKIYVGLGGSATSDGGMGLAVALGYRFLDADGGELSPSGAALERIAQIQAPRGGAPDGQVEIVAVNDVSNPLYGPDGAAFVYGPQKGAGPRAVQALDRGLRNLSRIVSRDLGIAADAMPGSGAAGGTAYGLHVFTGARFVSGSDYMLRQSGAVAFLENHSVDFILTGEGSLDAQSLQGKWIQGVLRTAGRYGIPVLAVCGRCLLDSEAIEAAGFFRVLQVSDPARPLEWNMQHAFGLTRDRVAGFFAEQKGG